MADTSSTFTTQTTSTTTNLYPTAAEIMKNKMTETQKNDKNKNAMQTVSDASTKIWDDYISKATTESKNLHKLMMSNGIFSDSDMSKDIYNNSFYPLPRIDPYNYVEGTREIVFFTRPSIPFTNTNIGRSPYLTYLNEHGYAHILATLARGRHSLAVSTTGPFMNILTNRISSNIDIPDISVESLETAQNMWGTKILYPKSSLSSDEGQSITCEFEDTKYLEIYNLFKAWDHFRKGKWMGIYDLNKTDVVNKILYDHISIYKFIIANDGETLLYWCKWTGLFPDNINRSTFSEIPKSGPLKLTISFKVSGWFDDMDPVILQEFNWIINQYYGITTSSAISRLWDISSPELDFGADQSPVLCPIIIPRSSSDSNNFKQPYFEWVKKS